MNENKKSKSQRNLKITIEFLNFPHDDWIRNYISEVMLIDEKSGCGSKITVEMSK